jgi:hypothetical protein
MAPSATDSEQRLYASPPAIENLADCYFYHSTDIPGHGFVRGEWDLRPGIDAYLGHFDFRGKRVLDIGAASGFLSFHMEKRGADVVSYDLSEKGAWDIVPFSGAPMPPSTRSGARTCGESTTAIGFVTRRFARWRRLFTGPCAGRSRNDTAVVYATRHCRSFDRW